MAAGSQTVDNLVDVLGMWSGDHDRIRLQVSEHLLVIVELGKVGQFRMRLLRQNDLLIGRVAQTHDLRLCHLLKIPEAIPLKSTTTHHRNSYFFQVNNLSVEYLSDVTLSRSPTASPKPADTLAFVPECPEKGRFSLLSTHMRARRPHLPAHRRRTRFRRLQPELGAISFKDSG